MRDYSTFYLPKHVPHFYIETLERKIVEAGLWDILPVHLLTKLRTAKDSGSGVFVTKEDLDSIPDDVWAKVLPLLK